MRGLACIGLDNPKNALNVGAVMRAAGVFGAALVAISGQRVKKLGSTSTDTMKTVRHLPLLRVIDLFQVVPFNCVPVAVELVEGATPLPAYAHPERAFYIFGGEDATLGRRVLDRCRDTVYIPAGCLNLAAAVNVVLYDRLAKEKAHGGS